MGANHLSIVGSSRHRLQWELAARLCRTDPRESMELIRLTIIGREFKTPPTGHTRSAGAGISVIPRRIVVDHSPTYVVPADPPANFLPTPSADDTGVMLINPKQNAGPVTYILNAIRYTMQPGYEQKLPAGRSWILEFDRGKSFGTAL